jgi:hypothetical protein
MSSGDLDPFIYLNTVLKIFILECKANGRFEDEN